MINFWSKLNIGITLFSRKWWKLVDIFGQYIIQVSFFEFMSNICCFDLFPFNLFTPKTNYVMLWLKRIKDQIVEKKYFEQEFHQVSTRQLIQYVLSAQNHTSYCTTKFMTIYKFGCFWKVLSSPIFCCTITHTILWWKCILNELSGFNHFLPNKMLPMFTFFSFKEWLCKWHWWKFNLMWWMWSKNQIEKIF